MTFATVSGDDRHTPCQTRVPSALITQIDVSLSDTSNPTYWFMAALHMGARAGRVRAITPCDSPPSLRAGAAPTGAGSRTGAARGRGRESAAAGQTGPAPGSVDTTPPG